MARSQYILKFEINYPIYKAMPNWTIYHLNTQHFTFLFYLQVSFLAFGNIFVKMNEFNIFFVEI